MLMHAPSMKNNNISVVVLANGPPISSSYNPLQTFLTQGPPISPSCHVIKFVNDLQFPRRHDVT
jgi:hypothetical protein